MKLLVTGGAGYTESAAPLPSNPYGASKLAADHLIGYAAAQGLAAVSLRHFNVAGASGCFGNADASCLQLIPVVLRAAAGRRDAVEVFGTDYPTRDGTAARDFIHVEDLGRAHILTLEAAEEGEQRVYNLGNGAGFTVAEVVQAAHRVTGRRIAVVESPRRPGDPAVVVASSQKIRAELGWKPEKPDLETMISDALDWIKVHSHEYEPGSAGD